MVIYEEVLDTIYRNQDYADINLVAAETPIALESIQHELDVHLLDETPTALESMQHELY